MIRTHRAPVLAVVLWVTALVAACGGGSKSVPSPTTASSTATSTRAATGTAGSALGIREIDLSKVADVAALVTASGGELVQSSVIYADLNDDGVDEAIVPISSGGTMGDIAFVVLTPSDGGTKTLLKASPLDQAAGLSVSIEGGQLVMTQPMYGPEDPNCCPSALRRTTYVWNGNTLAVQTVKTEVNPAGGGKTTPAPTTAP